MMAKKKNGEQATALLPLGEAGEIKDIPVLLIDPSPFQTRQVPGVSDMELPDSIAQDGQLIPIRVRPVGERYEIVFGHRRLAAAIKLERAQIRAEVVEMDDTAAFRALMVENSKRRDLGSVEEALQFAHARDDFRWSVRAIAQARGCSESHVRQRLALLEMPVEVLDAVQAGRLKVGQAEELRPLVQLGAAVVKEIVEAIAKQGPDNVAVDRTVEQIFRSRTIALGDDTPFAWQEECAANGCLAKAPDGKPVCTSPSNYVRSVVVVQADAMAAAVREYRQKHEKKDGVGEDLPVYYALRGVIPDYGPRTDAEIEQPPDYPACPLQVAENTYSTGQALFWSAHLPLVADKDACRKCPAWPGKGPGRALLVEPASPSAWRVQHGPTVTLLCMDSKCRGAKQKEGQSVAQQREVERDRALGEAQAGLKAKVLAAADKLAGDRVRTLASALVRRDGRELQLDYGYTQVAATLGISVPPSGDQLLHILMALGEEALLRMLALRQIERLDGAYDYRSLWLPKKLSATVDTLLGATVKEQLEESLQAAGEPTRGHKAKPSGGPKE